jgi:hypothetical protein
MNLPQLDQNPLFAWTTFCLPLEGDWSRRAKRLPEVRPMAPKRRGSYDTDAAADRRVMRTRFGR